MRLLYAIYAIYAIDVDILMLTMKCVLTIAQIESGNQLDCYINASSVIEILKRFLNDLQIILDFKMETNNLERKDGGDEDK